MELTNIGGVFFFKNGLMSVENQLVNDLASQKSSRWQVGDVQRRIFFGAPL